MGMSNMQVQQPMQQGSGKGFASNQAAPTNPPLESIAESTPPYFDENPNVSQTTMQNISGMNPGQQPRFGQPNRYSNTVSSWDNASIQPAQQRSSFGKGSSSQQPQQNGKFGNNATRGKGA